LGHLAHLKVSAHSRFDQNGPVGAIWLYCKTWSGYYAALIQSVCIS